MQALQSEFAQRFRKQQVQLRRKIRAASVVLLHLEGCGLVVHLTKKEANHIARESADRVQAEFTEHSGSLRLYPVPF